MSENRYWSVEDCCWVTLSSRGPSGEVVETAAGEVDLPRQRVDEVAEEPVDA